MREFRERERERAVCVSAACLVLQGEKERKKKERGRDLLFSFLLYFWATRLHETGFLSHHLSLLLASLSNLLLLLLL
jgi:hypothetical protein